MDNKLPFMARGGTIPGRDHVLAGHNRQDWYRFDRVTIRGQEYIIAVISDGCGQKLHSEVGAILLPTYAYYQTVHLLEIEKPLAQIPDFLYISLVGYLEAQWKLIPFRFGNEMVAFIDQHLLATVTGFIIGESESVMFHAGRCRFLINEEVTAIEHQEDPYPGAQLLPRSAVKNSGTEVPYTFSRILLKTTELITLALSTDGFTPEMLKRFNEEVFEGETGVQRWLNFINGPRNSEPGKGIFLDDATVILVDRTEGN